MSHLIKKANGIEGLLIWCGTKFMFRVYDSAHNFIDYDIHHNDLCVTIKDKDAYFYHYKSGRKSLNHAPENLGIEVDWTLQTR